MIDQKTIEKLASLSRLKIQPHESEEFSKQLSKVLGYFEQISKVNTDGIEPMVTPTEILEYWRADEVEHSYTADEMTANAPAKMGNLFKVPPVV